MKIAYISRAFIPSRTANSVHVMKMCGALARSGHQVVLFAPRAPGAAGSADEWFRYYGVAGRFEIRKLLWLPFPGRGLLYNLLAALSAQGARVDLVYSRLLSGGWFAGLLGLPVVYEAHEPPPSRMARGMLSRLAGGAALRRVVVISSALSERFLEVPRLRPELLMVAHDAADPAVSAPLPELAGAGQLKVGYVGQLYPGRGIGLILALAERCRFAEFHLVGGLEADLELWRSRAAGLPNVHFHGHQPPARLDGYRAAVDVLIAPYERSVSVHGGESDTSRWMSPLKLFEYMAAGKPIVASNHPVLREVLSEEQTALLCDPDDLEAWGLALERLRDDGDLRSRLGRAALQRFEAGHTWSARARQVLSGFSPSRPQPGS